MNFANKVIVITGAASGIGFAIAQKAAELNMRIVMTDVNAAALESAVSKLILNGSAEVLSLITDVSDFSAMQKLSQQTIERFSEVDILVNNAGISGPLGRAWEIDLAQLQQVLNINLLGVVHGAKAFVPKMLSQNKPAHIVNVASMLGLINCSYYAPYLMSKHAVLAFSESLHFDLQQEQSSISVTVMCPGFVQTNIIRTQQEKEQSTAPLLENIAHLVEQSISAKQVAEQLFLALINKQFYVFTDAETKLFIQQRFEDILQTREPTPHLVELMLKRLGRRK